MNRIKQKAIDFLKSYQMDVTDVDFESDLTVFSEQMVQGLAGKESCLEMIPTYIQAINEIPLNQPVIVADAGGTNFRVATVHFNEEKHAVIENQQNFPMPAIERELGHEEFFETMAGYFKEVAADSDRIGFCFSYPVEILPNKDGRLIRFAKEIKAPEVIGKRIGHHLNLAVAHSGYGDHKHIVMLNDTVATLLAGVGYAGREFSGYIGFILGTGTNGCYVEENANITKHKDLDTTQSQIVNTESGGMDKIHTGQIDRMFDATTSNPGVHIFEKMIAGVYLGPLYWTTIRRAAEDGLLSAPVAEAVSGMGELTTKEMNDFLFCPFGDNPPAKVCRQGTSDDVTILYTLADRLTERAAKLAALNLSALAVKSARGTDPAKPICIVAEGTTFYHMKTLKSRVEYYLKQNLEDKRGIHTEIINVENATLIGAAIAGLTN